MQQQAEQNILTVVDATADGEGVYVRTSPDKHPGESKARIFLNVTALVGSSTPKMTMKIVALVAAVDQQVGIFTESVAGASQESIVIDACPAEIKAVFTESGTVTDFDCTVTVIRF